MRSTKPLAYQGTLIHDIAVRSRAAGSSRPRRAPAEDVLTKMLETDDGAAPPRRGRAGAGLLADLGSGLLFYSTLYDENASSHIALGQAYSKCFLGGGERFSEEEVVARGANRSLIHVDWMIGSGTVDVDGIAPDGTGSTP